MPSGHVFGEPYKNKKHLIAGTHAGVTYMNGEQGWMNMNGINTIYPAIILAVVSTVLYQIIQKTTPDRVNPLISLFVSYLVAAALCIIIYPFFNKGENLLTEFTKLNWTSIALGIVIVGIEIGFMYAYRAGAHISTTSLITSSLVILLLAPVGILIFKEDFSVYKAMGGVMCVVGIGMIYR